MCLWGIHFWGRAQIYADSLVHSTCLGVFSAIFCGKSEQVKMMCSRQTPEQAGFRFSIVEAQERQEFKHRRLS